MNTVDKSAADDDGLPPGTASAYRTRARQRLIGALVLALSAAVLMPVFFHSEPRVPRPELRITMPSRDSSLEELTAATSKQQESPNPGAASQDAGLRTEKEDPQGPSASNPADLAGVVAQSGVPKTAAASTEKSEAKAPGKVDAKNEARTDAKAEAKNEAKPDVKAEAKSEAKPDVKAEAKNEAKPDAKAERYTDQYILRAGAYSQAENADAQVARLRKLGVKVYTDRISTPRGDRIRVRVGPFASRSEALRIQTKLRQAQVETTLAGPDA